jgi:hypothetical protein
MFSNRPLRVTLAALLVGFAWLMLSTWPDDFVRVRVARSMMAAFALLLALGIVAPIRGRIALRLGAGIVGAVYVIYFGRELWHLVLGERQPLRPGQPSATMAGLGLLVYGVPMLIFAVSGYPGRRYRSVGDFLRGKADDGT